MTTADPRSGDDTFDLIDNAVAALADRRGVWLGHDLHAIALIASLVEQAERWLPQLVHDARANGYDWTEIARAVGTNPNEARLRFDPESPIADRLGFDVEGAGAVEVDLVVQGGVRCAAARRAHR